MPSEGTAPWLPFAGLIRRSLASSAACAAADAEACALLCAGETVEWLPPLLHAVANRAMTAATARPAYRRACRADLRSVPRTVTSFARLAHQDAFYLRSANGNPVRLFRRLTPLSGNPHDRPGQRQHGEHDDHVLRPRADPVRQRAVAHQRYPRVEDGLLPHAAVRDQAAVRRDDRALPGGRRVHHGAVRFHRPDPGYRRLLLGLAELAVDLEVGVVGLHREQVGARGDLRPDQVVEGHLVADHVAEPDFPDAEHHRSAPRGEVDRLQRREVAEAGDDAAVRDVLTERHELALDVRGGRPAAGYP